MSPIAGRLLSSLRTTANRRRLLTRSAALGAGISILPARPSTPRARAAGSTFTLAANWAPNDIDPHSGYDPGSGFILAGLYESLIRQRPGPGVQLEPWLAESWETNEDESSWTFHLRPGVTFHDGSPLTAQVARDSYVRQMTLQRAPTNVLGRFLDSAEQIVAVDDLTLRLDLGRPQPVFGIAMAAPFGTSPTTIRQASTSHSPNGLPCCGAISVDSIFTSSSAAASTTTPSIARSNLHAHPLVVR